MTATLDLAVTDYMFKISFGACKLFIFFSKIELLYGATTSRCQVLLINEASQSHLAIHNAFRRTILVLRTST